MIADKSPTNPKSLKAMKTENVSIIIPPPIDPTMNVSPDLTIQKTL
jgi:hypothetical protein